MRFHFPCLKVRGIVSAPVLYRLYAVPPRRSNLARGFLFALVLFICYIVQYQPWTGKLRADCRTLRSLSAWPHRSGDKEAKATESCVGRQSRKRQDVAISQRRLSGSGLLPADRPRVTNANDNISTTKTGLRQPATRWAKQRKLSADSCWATQTKDLRFGLTDRPACGFLTHKHATETEPPSGEPAIRPTWLWCATTSARSILSGGNHRQSAAKSCYRKDIA